MSTPSTNPPGPDSAADGLPAAVLWDMDGTLVDTEPYWMAEEIAIVESYGGVWTAKDAQAIIGTDLLFGATYIVEHSPVELTPREVVDAMLAGVRRRVQELGAPWRPGARELLGSCVEAGIPCAMVTMSWRMLTDAVVGALPPGTFSAVVTGDEVTRGKPAPDPYLTAAAALDLPPGACIAIEDSPSGVASAVAAGVPTIAVPHVVAVPVMAGAVQIPTLAGLRVQDLRGVVAGRG